MIIHDVEQNSPEWFALRAGMPTASEFKRLVTSTGARSKSLEAYAAQLAAEKYAGRPLDRWEGNQWTIRGHELEAEAIAAYEFFTGRVVARVGFVTPDIDGLDTSIGCSPDGIVMNGEGIDRALEVKCLSAQNHVLAHEYYANHERVMPEYVQQIHGEALICMCALTDIFFYHPDLPALLITVPQNNAFVEGLSEAIVAVLNERDRLIGVMSR